LVSVTPYTPSVLFLTRDGILGLQFNKRLESFAPSFLHSLLLADFKENHTLLLFYKYTQKFRETRKLESIHEKHFVQRKNKGRKLESHKTRVNAQNPRLKMPFKNSISKMEYLDFNLTKDLILLLHTIHSPVYWRILKKTILFCGIKILTKISAKKLESIDE
jgi:hypothetical protein